MKNILFITWDGAQTTYMEGLFLPIFNEIQKENSYQFHIIQFTWAPKERTAITERKARECNIKYSAKKIYKKPNALIGSFFTVIEGVSFIKKYLQNNKIDIIMPRSTMPSIMVNRLNNIDCKILFDADGLPIEERIDFSGLKKSSLIYNIYKREERLMLKKAAVVITRSKKAIDFHLDSIGNSFKDKFFVVVNGIDTQFFIPDGEHAQKLREDLNIKKDSKVFIYSGSLGPQYGFEIMINVFKSYLEINKNGFFLILTTQVDFAKERIPVALQDKIILKSVPFAAIPKYLSIGDIAFAIRDPKPSMQGVAPIKLGEYLLMGLPTIASLGIGDTEMILKDKNFCMLYNHNATDSAEKALVFIEKAEAIDKAQIQKFASDHFSLEISAASYNKALNYC
jgi:glycosyltransferase involved in cell wall biosynthesis